MAIDSAKIAKLELETLNTEELLEVARNVLSICAVRKTATIANGSVRIKWESGKSEFTLRGIRKTTAVFE